ncbi:MAG TPA: hypothetical protein VE913_23605 [Longimicrobium sp.]|nr:hypothetical protein [Longimicrobium sp.]
MMDRHPTWDIGAIAKVVCGSIQLGFTPQQVRAGWGRPRDITRSIYTFGVHEQWVYDGGYVYFEDGVVTSIQN